VANRESPNHGLETADPEARRGPPKFCRPFRQSTRIEDGSSDDPTKRTFIGIDPRERSKLERNFTAQAPDELWVADITSFRRGRVFISRSRVRCLHPSDRQLVDGQDTCHPTGAWRSQCADPGASSTTPIRVRNIHRSSSASAAARPVCVHQRGRWETPATVSLRCCLESLIPAYD
jgi:hypothetical protein